MKYIVHVDDDLSDRWDFKYLVNSIEPNLEISSFSNGLELLQYLGETKEEKFPSVIFLDFTMPIWDGLKTLRVLKNEAKYSYIPVYIFATRESHNEEELVMQSGATGILTKPALNEDFVELKEKLSMILSKFR